MTRWSTDEGRNTTLVLAVLQIVGWCVVSERMLVSILSVSLDPHEMSRAEAALALASLRGSLKPEDLLRPFFLMLVLNYICPESSSASLSFIWQPDQT